MSLAYYRPEQDWLQCFVKHGNHYICVWRISQKVLYYPLIEDPPVVNTIIVDRNGTSSTLPSVQHTRTFHWNDEDWTRVLEFQDAFYRHDLPEHRYYVQFHRDEESHRCRETHWWAPEGPQIVLSNVSSTEFNTWLTHAATLLGEDLHGVLNQPPVELDLDEHHGIAPHSDRIRHMAYEHERRTRRRLMDADDDALQDLQPHHADLTAGAPSHAAPGGCNLD